MIKLCLKIIVLLGITTICIQCNSSNKDVNVEVEVKRFDVDFYTLDTVDFESSIRKLAERYPKFYPVFVEHVLAIADDYSNYSSYADELYSFRVHPSMIGLFDSVQYHYPSIEFLEDGLHKAFLEYRKCFKEAVDLEVVTFISEFSNKAILYEGGIGISLDMFLGEQYPFYKGIQLPDFIIQNLNKEQIVPNAMRVLAEDYSMALPPNATFLDAILLEGKRLYFAEQMLPDVPKYQLIEYSANAYDWCIENEFNIWAFFIENKLLYNSKFTVYRRYIEEGPSTMGMPPESPGKIGVWVGWQIVRRFMQVNKNVSLEELMRMNNGQELLDKSRYKPRAK